MDKDHGPYVIPVRGRLFRLHAQRGLLTINVFV